MKEDAREDASLRARSLSIGYRHKGSETKIVASGLDLHLARGELVCLLGPNGCGKSTLIRALCGMAQPLSGSVSVNGRPFDQLSPRQRARSVSVVLTDPVSVGMMSVNALVALGRHPHTNWTGALGPRDRERIQWALDAIDGRHLAQRHVGELSDGERQKVLIARALAQEASIMLLDEPTAFLDLPRRVELMRILRDLAHQQSLSILLSTHDLDLALRSADRLWLFNPDQTLSQGTPEHLALTGSIAQAFASDKLDWDTELGSFRMHRDPCVQITLAGQGPEATWTRRALARLGYGITDPETQPPAFRIAVAPNSWTVALPNGEERNFPSLGDFTLWLQRQSPSLPSPN